MAVRLQLALLDEGGWELTLSGGADDLDALDEQILQPAVAQQVSEQLQLRLLGMVSEDENNA